MSSPDALHIAAVELARQQHARITELEAQRAELLSALKDCLAFLDHDMPTASSGPERRKARAAIAKAGGQP